MIKNPSQSEDVQATIRAVEAYGAEVELREGSLSVTGVSRIKAPEDVVNCGESASTARFVAPILSHAEGISVVTGGPSLRKRPMQPLIDAMRQLGVLCYSARSDGCAPLVMFGPTFRGGRAQMVGDVSSQFVSGLLFSAPLAPYPTLVELSTQLESKPYVQMTLEVLRHHGVKVYADTDLRRFTVDGNQPTSAYDHVIEGDYSSAAFLLVAGAVTGSEIRVTGLRTSGSLQGDREVLSILGSMGAEIHVNDESALIERTQLRGTEIEAADCPDLVPPLAVAACYAQGTTRITHAERLRVKESDRLRALSSELGKMGARVRETRDGLEITGGPYLKGTDVEAHGDHRIAMACAVAALGARGITRIHGAACVGKSYPSFFDDLKRLGGDVLAGE
jgi:3-phosphoshikimate 1-carboxyvinyltransferase